MTRRCDNSESIIILEISIYQSLFYSLSHIVWPLTVHISKDSVPDFHPGAHAHLMLPRLRRQQAGRLVGLPASESPSEVRGLSPTNATAAHAPLLIQRSKSVAFLGSGYRQQTK